MPSSAAAPRYLSTAAPLALIYALLIVYASLYPFGDWRATGLPLWHFLSVWPRYVQKFDVVINVIGYLPLGLLVTAAVLHHRSAGAWAWRLLLIWLACSSLSFALETTQNFLADRIPSVLDLLLNSLGIALGVLLAALARRQGWLQAWQGWRRRWMQPDTRNLFVHLSLWPFALLFPTTVPFGLGQFYERLEQGLVELLQDTPFLRFIPFRALEFEPMLPVMQSTSVAIGLLLPLWSLDLLLKRGGVRILVHITTVMLGILVLALSFSLSYGPENAWVWWTPAVRNGVLVAVFAGMVTVWAPKGWIAIQILLALVLQTLLLNHASTDVYADLAVQQWEQGRFVRFYGLTQWLGWIWPYLLGVFVTLMLLRRKPLDGAAFEVTPLR